MCKTLLLACALLAAGAMSATTPRAQDSDAAARPAPCSSADHRAFDFWVGTWDVRAASRPDAAPSANVITRVHGGCALHERYTTPSGFEGSSLSFFNAKSGRWHQTWIDNTGNALHLEGALEDGHMVLSETTDSGPWQRITWTPVDDDTVRQHWETSTDGGASWKTVFDGLYTRRR